LPENTVVGGVFRQMSAKYGYKSPIHIIRNDIAIPKKSGSIVAGRRNFPSKTDKGPAMVAIIA